MEANGQEHFRGEAGASILPTAIPPLAHLLGRRMKPRTPEERAVHVKWLAAQCQQATTESSDRQQH